MLTPQCGTTSNHSQGIEHGACTRGFGLQTIILIRAVWPTPLPSSDCPCAEDGLNLTDTESLAESLADSLPTQGKANSRAKYLGALIWLAIVVTIGLFLMASWSKPLQHNVIDQQAYFVDSGASMSFKQAQAQSYIPYQGNITQGYSSQATWLRLRIDPSLAPEWARAQGEPLVLRIRPPYLDSIELFDPLEPLKNSRITGERHPWLESEVKSLNHGFILPLGEQPRDVWLRIETDSTVLIGVDALPLSLMNAQEQLQNYFNSLDLVFLFFLLVLGVVLYWMQPDRVVAGYVAVQLTLLLYAAFYYGVFRIQFASVLPAALANDLFTAVIMLMSTAYIFFFRRLFSEYDVNPWLLRWLLPIQFYPVVGFVLLYAGYKSVAAQTTILLAMIAFIGLLVVAILLLIRPADRTPSTAAISARWIAGAYLVFMLGIVVVVLPATGVFQASDISLYRNGFTTLFSSTLLGSILFVRARRYEARRLQSIVSSVEAAKFERRRREEQNQFFTMLTHEIRTPLTVMSYASKTAMSAQALSEQIDRCINEIDEIIERCEQVDRLEQDSQVIEHHPASLRDLIETAVDRFHEKKRVVLNEFSDMTFETDRALFNVVVSNLIDNALKYSEKHSSVRVNVRPEVREQRPGVAITVTNHLGPYALPDPNRLYDKYYRSTSAHANTGSGLGLYLVKAFTEKLGGTIRYSPAPPLVEFEAWIPT